MSVKVLPINWSIGYNTHGNWSSLDQIYKLEVQEWMGFAHPRLQTFSLQLRDNEWFDDSKIDRQNWLAIWVTEDPALALLYNYRPEIMDYIGGQYTDEEWSDMLNDDEDLTEQWEIYRDEADRVRAGDFEGVEIEQIDLTDTLPVLDDLSGGVLFIKRK